ncbi:MAG TPA: protein phosphatase 2C domain-containing protein, partial [Armatimonadota bacterium]|nr:protein phosphatase 2C domain-containing protein [Armatimonadota bacterium]
MSSVPADHLGGGTPPWCVTRSTVNGRENNEDSFHAYQLVPTPGRPPMIVLSLADGMGGHAFGECVSREALRKVALTLFENLVIESGLNVLGAGPPLTRQSLERALMGALELANAHILRMVEANHWPKAGSTLVCAVVVGARAVVANLGDSPLFLYRDGVVTQITEDHTVAGVLLRAGLIT